MREKRVKAGETDMYERADTQERRSSEKQTLNQHARAIAAPNVLPTMADENHIEVPVPDDGAPETSNGHEQDSVELAPTSQKGEDDVKGECFVSNLGFLFASDF
ncbi:methionine aminopeptidase 2B-like isoform X3 [Cucumis melo var. makuwa]|uniref:Methionine aminopeptidase 2B-like isoform X3 n=1 Tax=Cucumis melo var. makuwa TaxID=1194695 RepID=A0A5A7TW71_CUCMM|nr:methionine aminopeptidase 2B-like isoform X3 [Cucumis melo var. makuwa]